LNIWWACPIKIRYHPQALEFIWISILWDIYTPAGGIYPHHWPVFLVGDAAITPRLAVAFGQNGSKHLDPNRAIQLKESQIKGQSAAFVDQRPDAFLYRYTKI
jgi:hypothetical protein